MFVQSVEFIRNGGGALADALIHRDYQRLSAVHFQ
jgi:hypothetical protein